MRRALRIYRRFAIAGIVLSFLGAVATYAAERRSRDSAEMERGSRQMEDVRQRLMVGLGELQAAAAYVEQATPPVKRFQSFLERLPLSREGGIPWIWARVIKPADAAGFESAMRSELGDPGFTVERETGKAYFAPVVVESGRAEARLGQDLSLLPAIGAALAEQLPVPGQRHSVGLAENAHMLAPDRAFVGLVFPSADPSRPPSVLLRALSPAVFRKIGDLDNDQQIRLIDATRGSANVLIDTATQDAAMHWLPTQLLDFGEFRFEFAVSRPQSRSFPWLWFPVLGLGLMTTFLVLSYRAAQINRNEASTLGARLSGTESELTAVQQREITFFENAGTGNCETDFQSGRLVRVNDAMCAMFGYTRDEMLGLNFADITHPDDIAMSRSALMNGDGKPLEQLQFEKRYLRKDGTTMWGLVNARLIFDASGNPRAYSTVIIDITARKTDEDTKSMLLRELAHRVRNTVQLTSSLARQTGRTARSTKEYESKFLRRLAALSGAQDLLFDTGWKAAPLRQLAERVIKPFLPEESDQAALTIDLPDIDLPTQQAQTIAIALHELTGNSTSFGALANGGEIRLTGKVSDDAATGKPVLHFVWDETINKRIRKPRKSGFGLVMLEQALPDQFGGTANLNWHSRGLVYEAHLPLP